MEPDFISPPIALPFWAAGAWADAGAMQTELLMAKAASIGRRLNVESAWWVSLLQLFNVQAIDAMLRQASAQVLQALAQSWQWSILCLPHSWLHAVQMSAQRAQIAFACWLFLAIAAAASAQMPAQSMSSAMQAAIFFTSGSCRQAAAQWLQATAQALQASIQALNLCGVIFATKCEG